MENFTDTIELKLCNSVQGADIPETDFIGILRILFESESKGAELNHQFSKAISDPTIQKADDSYNHEFETKENYIGMKLWIIRGLDSDAQEAYVKMGVDDDEGRPVGVPHDNHIMNLRQYEVAFLDGETEVMTATLIAENIISQVDDY